MRICAQSVRSLCACAQTSVEVLGFFLFAHSNAHRLLCSPLRTDVGAHAHRLRTDCAQMRTAAVRILTDVCAHLHRSDVQFRTDHSSPLLTDVGAHAHRLRTDCAQMRTDVGAHPHRSIYNSSPTISSDLLYCNHDQFLQFFTEIKHKNP